MSNNFIADFLDNGKRNPSKEAIRDVLGSYSYSELAHLSNCVAEEIGCNNLRVGVLLPRCKEFLVASIGVLRVGCAYIPIDAEYPLSRIKNIMLDSNCHILITTKALVAEHRLNEVFLETKIIILQDIINSAFERKIDKEWNIAAPDKEGVILYTSGSTGKPKGVVHNQAIIPVVYNPVKAFYNEDSSCKHCIMASFNFVSSMLDLYLPLSVGGSVYVANEEERINADKLYDAIVKNDINVMFMPPKLLQTMLVVYGKLPLDCVFVGGEKLGELPAYNLKILNFYGSTETGASLIYKVTGEEKSGYLGYVPEGVKAYLIDENNNEIKESGVLGELCLTTPSLAVKYNNLPEQTADRFVACPFEAGRKMYKTGDLMAWNEDGSLQFHGRKDRMVKLRGYRVELGEVESVIMKYSGIAEAVCVAKRLNGGDKLCCYYESSQEIIQDEMAAPLAGSSMDYSAVIKNFVAEFLPDYMVPEIFIELKKIPRNANGKVDLKAINEMEIQVEAEEYIPPVTELEKMLCQEYEELLKLDKVSVLTDFFNYGGTSLTASILTADMKRAGYSMSYQDISRHPSPRELAVFLENNSENKIDLSMNREYYPLTKTQMGIYLEGLAGGSKDTYTSPYMMKAAEGVTPEMLKDAVQKVLAAHPNMKYIIKADYEGTPHMYLTPDAAVEIPVYEGKAENRLEFMQEFVKPIEVIDNFLFRFAIYNTEVNCYLAMCGHLMFYDGTTISLLIAELNRALAGQNLIKEEYSIQQVGILEEQLMLNGSHDRAKKYYDELFSNMSGTESIIGDLNEPLVAGISKNQRFAPNTISVAKVKSFCAAYNVTESAFFMSAISILLGKYLNSEHVSFSTVYNGRSLAETSNTMGTLIKRIPVYGNLANDISVSQYVQGMGRQLFDTMSNDIYSFDEILKNYPVNEDVEFIYQGDLFTDNMGKSANDSLIEGDKYFMEHYHTGMVTGCMSIQFFATAGYYNMTIEYRNQRFSQEWVLHFAENLFAIAEEMLQADKISNVVMLPNNSARMISQFNDTAVNINFTPVHQQIHNRALNNPDKLAVISNGIKLTFRELDLLSNQLAEKLIAKGIKKDVLVAVLLDRAVWAYVAENAILKAGGAFLPFVPSYPDERIDFCMKDGNVPVVITTEAEKFKRSLLLDNGYEFITLEEIFAVQDIAEIKPDENYSAMPAVEVKADDLAYCIYTSGSTGRPKGVMIEHLNIANYVHKNEKSIEIMHYADENRVCFAMAAFSFDVSIVEQFIPLCNGNTVYLATEEEIHDPFAFAKAVLENNVTGLTCTPTYLLGLLDIPEAEAALQQITFFDIGAEAFPAGLYDRLRKLRSDSVILNVYGPTECTMGCAASIMDGSGSISVGGPIANTSFYVADKFGNELPVGIKGELIICGDCVGRGYVNLPKKTAAAFFTHNGIKAYHSGDLAAWNEKGEIRIFGRIDNQVKLRGFRIELDEIENVMGQFAGIKTSAVAVKKKGNSEFLAAYFTADCEIDVEALKEFLQEKLTEYMVPSTFMQLEEMPQTVNGKTDRRALPEPDFQEIEIEYIAPRNEIEKQVCTAMEDVLKQEAGTIGILHDFFSLGGDSLGAMRLLAKLNNENLSARDIFQNKTPEKIAGIIAEKANDISLDERDDEARKTAHSLTPMQIQMLDVQFYNMKATMWSNMHFFVKFDDDKVDAERLRKAVNTAIHHHPGLSVVFSFNEDGDFEQRYVPDIIPEVKMREVDEEEIEDLRYILVVPFKHILNSCLCRARMFKTPKHSYLFMDIHHLLMDGGSLDILLQSIVKAYNGEELERDYYFAFLAEEEKLWASSIYEEDKAYFENKLSGVDWCNIPPVDYAVEAHSSASDEVRLAFTKEQVEIAEKKHGVSHSVMAVAAALMALGEYSGKNKVMSNWIFNYRLSPIAENVVGMLIKNLPVALDLDKFNSKEELLREVQKQVNDGIAHCSYDYFTARDATFVNDPMEVNLQLGINGTALDSLEPELIPLEEDYFAPGARLELELLENDKGDGGFDAEIEYVAEIYNRKNILNFHGMYIKQLEDFILE